MSVTSLSASASGQAQRENGRKAAEQKAVEPGDPILRPDSNVLWNGAADTVNVSFIFSTEAGLLLPGEPRAHIGGQSLGVVST